MTLAIRLTSTTERRAVWLDRVSYPDACSDRLYFAQVREDARVELKALQPQPGDRAVVVTSGACTALSLLGAGVAEVHAVDVNRAQNHLAELKFLAVRHLSRLNAIGFLGGTAMGGAQRQRLYSEISGVLTAGARQYWDRRPGAIRRGVIKSGVSERFIGLVSWFVRHVVHTPDRVDRMLACHSLEEQRDLFAREWDSRRWRLLFAALLNRWSMSRAYDPRFFENVGRTNFAEHFLGLANHALTEIPIADNYFLQQMLGGRYPIDRPEGVPPYLGEAGQRVIARAAGKLVLADGSMTSHLRSLPDRSVHKFALSNIGEWLDADGIVALFREVERVAAPGARVIFRNFVGWTDLPPSCTRLTEDPALGAALMFGDRSVVQARVVVCRVED